MRKILYAAILIALWFAPLERLDIAKLLPVQAVALYMEDDSVVLEIEEENRGRGENVEKALENLKQNTAAVVYLDTAEYLLISESATNQAKEIARFVKPSVKVCVCDAKGRVKESAEYLETHGNLLTLREWSKAK